MLSGLQFAVKFSINFQKCAAKYVHKVAHEDIKTNPTCYQINPQICFVIFVI